MATNNIAAAPNPYADDQLAIDRRRRIAEALSEQSAEPMGAGGMVGNVYVGPSWTQGLAKLFQGYVGGQAMKAADQQQRELNQRRMGDVMASRRAIAEKLMPQETPYPVKTVNQPDFAGAWKEAASSFDPGAMSMVTGAMDIHKMLNPGLQVQSDDKNFYLIHPTTGAVANTIPKYNKPLVLDVGDGFSPRDPLNPSAAVGENIPINMTPSQKNAALNNLIGPDGKVNQPLVEVKKNIARAGATNINNVNNAGKVETEYGKKFANAAVEKDMQMYDAATKAPQLADRANSIIKILNEGNVATGMGADFKLGFGRLLSAAGLGGDDYVKNTELLGTQLAQGVLDAVKASGLGSGTGFSNTDREFVEKVQGGKISINEKTLRDLAAISHRVAQNSAKVWNARVVKIPADAIAGTGWSTDPIEVAPFLGAPKAPANNAQGRSGPVPKSAATQGGGGWKVERVGK